MAIPTVPDDMDLLQVMMCRSVCQTHFPPYQKGGRGVVCRFLLLHLAQALPMRDMKHQARNIQLCTPFDSVKLHVVFPLYEVFAIIPTALVLSLSTG